MDAPLAAVIAVLNREVPLDHLGALKTAISGRSTSTGSQLANFAVSLDSSALLNLVGREHSTEVIDYLGEIHQAPVIVPSQSLQEFWNSRLVGVQGVADRLQTAFDNLDRIVREIDPEYDGVKQDSALLVAHFRAEFGHVLDERTAVRLSSLMETLTQRATVPQIPRSLVQTIADERKATKTPPGFKDPGDGDFYVWAETLVGLASARASGRDFEHVVLVSDDVKKDWSTKGSAHPTLVAEVSALFRTGFSTWTSRTLAARIAEYLDDAERPPRAAELE